MTPAVPPLPLFPGLPLPSLLATVATTKPDCLILFLTLPATLLPPLALNVDRAACKETIKLLKPSLRTAYRALQTYRRYRYLSRQELCYVAPALWCIEQIALVPLNYRNTFDVSESFNNSLTPVSNDMLVLY